MTITGFENNWASESEKVESRGGAAGQPSVLFRVRIPDPSPPPSPLDALASHSREWQSLIAEGRLKSGTPPAACFGDEQDIRRVLSDLRKKLKALGPLGMILADALPERGRFSLDVPGELIHVS